MTFRAVLKTFTGMVLASSTALAQDLAVVPTPPDTGATSALVTVEPVIAFGERKRADGAVQASTEDETLARWNLGGSADPAHPSNRSGFHVAPRIVVDTTAHALPPRSSTKGVLSQLAVLSQSRNHGYWPFRICYEAGLRRLQTLRGKVSFRMTVARSGRVTGSRLLKTEGTKATGGRFADADVASCVVTRARELSFTPAPARRVDVDVTVELNPGDAPLPSLKDSKDALTTKPVATAVAPVKVATATRGELRDAQEALAARTNALSACYAGGLGRDPGLWGRIGVRMSVDRGVVKKVAQHDTRFPDREVVTCVAALVQEAAQETPFCRAQTSPLELEWGVRFGAIPAPIAPAPASSLPTADPHMDKSVVAETSPARVPVGN